MRAHEKMGRIPVDFGRNTICSSYKHPPGKHRRDDRFWGMNGLAKRSLDLCLTIPAIIFLLPVFALIAIAVRLDGGPALYSQKRVGRGGSTFRMMKFRTMRVDAEDILERVLSECPTKREEWDRFQKLWNDPRITPLVRILRKSSLDELPQLANVLAGQMALVGQRPILLDQRQQYGAHIVGYVRARPGLTGHWQIRGRNALSFVDRAEMGSEYIHSWSLCGDMKLLLQTVPALLFSRRDAC